jgi:hypothetical protein
MQQKFTIRYFNPAGASPRPTSPQSASGKEPLMQHNGVIYIYSYGVHAADLHERSEADFTALMDGRFSFAADQRIRDNMIALSDIEVSLVYIL